ncbi:prolipoprotein diacylglyceryl transferase [Mycoplasmoides alvi]|uniref:prolipoprotein diacylglyceryl transferase n=1 Tax=Mycoplasmoides alvi TaxID=78580 RepID=UPI0006991878|nr:prolipoprotein diacylglyceryl transferase [Mycoplasmoides alvi]
MQQEIIWHQSGHPDNPAFSIGDFNVQWYGIFFALGIFFAICFIIIKFNFFHKINDTPFYIFIFIAVPTMILGARSWSFIIGDSKIGVTPFFDFANGFAGLAIQGAVLASTIVGLIWFGCILRSPKYFVNTSNSIIKNNVFTTEIVSRQVSMWTIADTLFPAILIGQAIGRWGNFFNHEVYGSIVQEAFLSPNNVYLADTSGLAFSQWGFLKILMPDVWNNMWIKTGNIVAFRVPIFLIESFMNVIMFCFLFYGTEYIKGYRAGSNVFSYFLGTGIVRLIIEIFRDQQFKFELSIILSSLFIVVGIIGIICSYCLFPKLRKYRCIYYLFSKSWMHTISSFIFVSNKLKHFFQKKYQVLTYKNVFRDIDKKKRHVSYVRDFWCQYYYNDNVEEKPYEVN